MPLQATRGPPAFPVPSSVTPPTSLGLWASLGSPSGRLVPAGGQVGLSRLSSVRGWQVWATKAAPCAWPGPAGAKSKGHLQAYLGNLVPKSENLSWKFKWRQFYCLDQSFESCWFYSRPKALVLFQQDMQTQSGNVGFGDSAHQEIWKGHPGVFPWWEHYRCWESCEDFLVSDCLQFFRVVSTAFSNTANAFTLPRVHGFGSDLDFFTINYGLSHYAFSQTWYELHLEQWYLKILL